MARLPHLLHLIALLNSRLLLDLGIPWYSKRMVPGSRGAGVVGHIGLRRVVCECEQCHGQGTPQVNHFSASPAASPRVYLATMLPFFDRPWRHTAALGAPAAIIRLAIPTWPLCPVNPSPSPAALAAALIRLARVSPISPNTRTVGATPSGRIYRRARAVTATIAGYGRFLPSEPSAGPCRQPTAPRRPGQDGSFCTHLTRSGYRLSIACIPYHTLRHELPTRLPYLSSLPNKRSHPSARPSGFSR